jgi:hypothetical protein
MIACVEGILETAVADSIRTAVLILYDWTADGAWTKNGALAGIAETAEPLSVLAVMSARNRGKRQETRSSREKSASQDPGANVPCTIADGWNTVNASLSSQRIATRFFTKKS